MGQEKSLLAALVAALSALAHCQRGQALVHCGEARRPLGEALCKALGEALGEALCSLSQGWVPVCKKAQAALVAALDTAWGLCHDSWELMRDSDLAVMG